MEQLYNRDAIESGSLAQFIIGLDPLAMNPSQLGGYRVLLIVHCISIPHLFKVLFVYHRILLYSLSFSVRVIFLKAAAQLNY